MVSLENVSRKKHKKIAYKEIRILHFTKKENIDKILSDGFDTSLPPIHGTGAQNKRDVYSAKNKLGTDILYFTTDKERWNKADVYVGEGKGTEDYTFYDYGKQKYLTEKKALAVINLSPVKATVKACAKILIIDSIMSYFEFQLIHMGEIYYLQMMTDILNKSKELGYDIVNIKHVKKTDWYDPDGKTDKYGEKDWYSVITGNCGKDDYFIINKEILNIEKSKADKLQKGQRRKLCVKK